ncbi:MAG: dihydroorotate dehydrogenase electron transfer subunit [Magnetococcales bacterium]|nr:dihydroorotate dehydrogenase electron transfer subunit [Magnetococcales bacterium]
MVTVDRCELRGMAQPLVVTVLFNRHLPGEHGLLRLRVGKVARQVQPGHFVQLICDPRLTLPRPFSVMDADPEQGSVDIFYRVVGEGTRIMASWKGGEELRVLMPLGRPFVWPEEKKNILLIAGGAGIAPVHFLARRLVERGQSAVLVWGIETEAPLMTIAARLDGFPLDVAFVESAEALAALDAVGVSSRLASMTPMAGRFHGYVTDLAEHYLERSSEALRRRTELYACGPTVMLRAVARLAERFGLSGQVSLEERMACGFGVCAACVVPVRQESGVGWSYRKICTEGPVFSLADIAWESG